MIIAYLIYLIIAKLYIWDCRRNLTPIINAFKFKVKIKYGTEKFVCAKTNKMDK